ncbi:hypothetical protein TNCV_886041 [Trichonephila clavipes]|nr:hypothetical protein TNCV_886041 [Trichonephila clavipes]
MAACRASSSKACGRYVRALSKRQISRPEFLKSIPCPKIFRRSSQNVSAAHQSIAIDVMPTPGEKELSLEQKLELAITKRISKYHAEISYIQNHPTRDLQESPHPWRQTEKSVKPEQDGAKRNQQWRQVNTARQDNCEISLNGCDTEMSIDEDMELPQGTEEVRPLKSKRVHMFRVVPDAVAQPVTVGEKRVYLETHLENC